MKEGGVDMPPTLLASLLETHPAEPDVVCLIRRCRTGCYGMLHLENLDNNPLHRSITEGLSGST